MNKGKTVIATEEKPVLDTHLVNTEETGSFEILDLSLAETTNIFSLSYSRRSYYSVTLLQGEYQLEFEDGKKQVSGNTLILTSTKIPFGIIPLNKHIAGITCCFSESFITNRNSGYRLQEFPIYKPGRQNIYFLNEEQLTHFIKIFSKIFDEKYADSQFKVNLQRIHLIELILNAQKLSPAGSFTRNNNTAEEIACAFIRLLESQFPIESPKDTIKLKTVKEFADELALHPNYLNRQVKISKNRTASDIIASRVMQKQRSCLN